MTALRATASAVLKLSLGASRRGIGHLRTLLEVLMVAPSLARVELDLSRYSFLLSSPPDEEVDEKQKDSRTQLFQFVVAVLCIVPRHVEIDFIWSKYARQSFDARLVQRHVQSLYEELLMALKMDPIIPLIFQENRAAEEAVDEGPTFPVVVDGATRHTDIPIKMWRAASGLVDRMLDHTGQIGDTSELRIDTEAVGTTAAAIEVIVRWMKFVFGNTTDRDETARHSLYMVLSDDEEIQMTRDMFVALFNASKYLNMEDRLQPDMGWYVALHYIDHFEVRSDHRSADIRRQFRNLFGFEEFTSKEITLDDDWLNALSTTAPFEAAL